MYSYLFKHFRNIRLNTPLGRVWRLTAALVLLALWIALFRNKIMVGPVWFQFVLGVLPNLLAGLYLPLLGAALIWSGWILLGMGEDERPPKAGLPLSTAISVILLLWWENAQTSRGFVFDWFDVGVTFVGAVLSAIGFLVCVRRCAGDSWKVADRGSSPENRSWK